MGRLPPQHSTDVCAERRPHDSSQGLDSLATLQVGEAVALGRGGAAPVDAVVVRLRQRHPVVDGFRVQGAGFRVQGSGSGFRVECHSLTDLVSDVIV